MVAQKKSTMMKAAKAASLSDWNLALMMSTTVTASRRRESRATRLPKTPSTRKMAVTCTTAMYIQPKPI